MKKSLALMLALIMVLCMIPTTAFAEAGDWDPLTDPNTVAGSLVERKTFSASTTMEAGKDGYLRLMPTLDAGNNSYNAMAYCGATATSNNTSIAEVKSIEIGKWVGGVWNNADCLQVTVNPKAAGTTTVVINFYYTFSQSPNPLTNPNAKWFYGTSYYTINVTEPTKPNPPTPENTSKPFIELTGEEAVKVHCTNDNANHDDKSYGLMHDGYTVGDVQGNKENGYTCDITVKPEKYVAQYNLDISGVTHTLVDSNQTGTIKLVWDKDNQKWKLATPSDVPVVFDVKCETQEPPTDNPPTQPEPENTSKPFIELTGEEAVKVHCTNDKANHDDKSYGLMHDGYTVGDVKADATNGYTCDITVNPDKYVDQYNLDIEVEHKLDPESQTGTIKLVWDKENQKWKLANPSGVPVVFDVECKNTQPENPAELTYFTKSRVRAITDNMPTPPEGVTFNTASPVTFDANHTTANLLYSFTVTGTPGAEVTITDTGAKFYNGTDWNTADKITVTLPAESITDYATYTVYGYRQFTKDNIINGALTNTATAGVEGSEKLVPGEATVPAEDKTGPAPSENPEPSPSTNPNPTPTPTPGGGNGGGHSHYYPTTTPVPVIVIPPKTGDMTIWQSILHFLGIR